jgi:putative transposase
MAKHNPQIHKRQSIRLRGYDYSQTGFYFITICCYQRESLFGKIVDGQMQLNPIGQLVTEEWLKSAEIRREVTLDTFVVMPNHFHGIVIIDRKMGENGGNDRDLGRVNSRSPLREIFGVRRDRGCPEARLRTGLPYRGCMIADILVLNNEADK